MREKRFDQALSNGQKQRLILAKMLYWLDENIDIVALDECTSGLDEANQNDGADAQEILEYLVRFCNQDKNRIVIISTHQNIDTFKNRLESDGFSFRNFSFEKEGECNRIAEI